MNAKQATDPSWLLPISAAEPCGPNVEYDPEYIVLSSRLTPRADVQYGKFIDKPEAPDWAEIERDCRRLLLRSQDVSVLIWLARCRARSGGCSGLAEGLQRLAAVLERYPDAVHPQVEVEGEHDPVVRANAIANLVDPEGFLGDVRDVVLSSNSVLRLTVRDVERALAIPPLSEAMDPDALRRQLAELREQGHAGMRHLADCHIALHSIEQWSLASLGEWAPVLDPLRKLLAPFKADAVPSSAAAAEAPDPSSPEERPMSMPTGTAHTAHPAVDIRMQREQVRTVIRQAKEWLEYHEPSSPVVILLNQAERLLGKRYADVAQAIPADLLARWDEQEG